MTQQEFTNRTKVEVSWKEFDYIHEMYMNNDMDKDEFCKMWVKMNKTRVEKAKAEAKAKAEEMKKREWLFKLYKKFDGKFGFDEFPLYFDVLSEKEQDRLKAYGFDLVTKRYCYELNDWYDDPRFLHSILFDIDEYLHKTA